MVMIIFLGWTDDSVDRRVTEWLLGWRIGKVVFCGSVVDPSVRSEKSGFLVSADSP